VTDPAIANPVFKEIGVLNFINRFLQNNLDGTQKFISRRFGYYRYYQHQPQSGHLMLNVSHDTLLSVFAIVPDFNEIDWNDWPKMMRACFQLDDEAFDKANAIILYLAREKCILVR
jgi:hypothetical protein